MSKFDLLHELQFWPLAISNYTDKSAPTWKLNLVCKLLSKICWPSNYSCMKHFSVPSLSIDIVIWLLSWNCFIFPIKSQIYGNTKSSQICKLLTRNILSSNYVKMIFRWNSTWQELTTFIREYLEYKVVLIDFLKNKSVLWITIQKYQYLVSKLHLCWWLLVIKIECSYQNPFPLF